ncbi:hypothetical protein LN149_002259 [Providencia stuartii]|nr:hypothetical protein [Providencia stuartii]
MDKWGKLSDKFGGLQLADRVNYLGNDIESNGKDEWAKYPRLLNFIRLWQLSTGGSFDINEHTDFFSGVNEYSLKQINTVFFERYGEPVWHNIE